MGDCLAPTGLRWRQSGPQSERRQSRAGARALHCTMELHAILVCISINVLFVCAKIHGGPRGRFDNTTTHHGKTANNHHAISARHTHYSYHPPTHINFICRHCTSVTAYPVYHGLPPTYVYKYRESGSRFGDLLTGLALYNLGRASEHWDQAHYYTRRPGEKCSLQVIDRSQFEEAPFPCFMMSSFLQAESQSHGVDTFDITSQIDVKPYLQATDSPIQVTRHHECIIWHNTTMNREKKVIPCVLLKEYSNSMKPSGLSAYIWLPVTIATVVAIWVCAQCCCKKKKDIFKEDAPLNQKPPEGFSPYYN